MASSNGEAILLLLKKAQTECDLFVILGDLFDLWVADGEYFKNRYAALIEAIKKVRDSGCPFYYFEGNHDLHLKKFWGDQLGLKISQGPRMIDYHGFRIWAEHGDEINRADRDYLFLRWFLRTPPLKVLAHLLPSKIVGAIGEKASASSRKYTARLANDSIEVFRNYARELRTREKFDLLVTGHTHIPDDISFEVPGTKQVCRLINLGSWFDGPHYLEVDSHGGCQMVTI